MLGLLGGYGVEGLIGLTSCSCRFEGFGVESGRQVGFLSRAIGFMPESFFSGLRDQGGQGISPKPEALNP